MSRNELTVAVVDDDHSVRRGLQRLLRAAGYRVETYSSAHEFLARDRVVPPACLLLDVSMPGQSGLRLHQALLTTGREVPVIFITGHADVEMEARAMKAGAAAFLYKPFDEDVLLRAVEQAIAKGRRRDP